VLICAFLGSTHVTSPMAPGVGAPAHDISLPVESQLVLELELGNLAQNGVTSSHVAYVANALFHWMRT
jgi:hypothetical protein